MMEKHEILQAAAYEIQKESDRLTLEKVEELIVEYYPGATSWTREYVGYDDMPGGDWYLVDVKRPGNEFDIAGMHGDQEDQLERINDLLGGIFEWAAHNEQVEKTIEQKNASPVDLTLKGLSDIQVRMLQEAFWTAAENSEYDPPPPPLVAMKDAINDAIKELGFERDVSGVWYRHGVKIA